MKRVVNGITRIRDPLYAPILKRHKKWLASVEASIYYATPLADLGLTDKRLDILFSMGLIQYNDDGGRNCYSISEKGKAILLEIK